MLRYNEYILESKNKKKLPEIIRITNNGNNKALIKFLKNNPTSINDIDDDGNTALLLACKNNLIFIVDTLLKNKADVNLSNNNGDMPLMEASKQKIIDMLLKVSNININKYDYLKNTALHYAAQNNKYKLEKLLEFDNIDVNIQNNWGKTALMNYIDNNIPEINILEKMINNGLNLDLKNNDDNNFYDILKSQIEFLNKINSSNVEKYIEYEKYLDKNFPQYKYQWDFKNKINKYNL